MAKFYQRLLVLILLVAGISCAVIYFTVDIHTLGNITAFKPWTFVAALVLMVIGLLLDGTRLMHLVYISNEKIRLQQAIQVVFGNYFLALLTPGAAGGAFAQVMFLRRAGVPIGKATVLVIVRTILSILFLLICMPMVFYFDPALLPWISEQALMIASCTIVGGILLTILLFRTRFPHYILVKTTKRLNYDRRRRIFSLYRDVRGAVFLLSSAPLSMFRVFIESGLSLLALYAVVPVLFIGMGASVDWVHVMGRMIFLNILLYFAPTPGGSGIAEGIFVVLFSDFLPSGTVGITAVVWRFIAEYLPFMIGLYFTVKVFGQEFVSKQIR